MPRNTDREGLPSDLRIETHDLGMQIRSRFLSCLGLTDPTPWEDLDLRQRNRWISLAEFGGDFVLAGVECQFRDFARKMAAVYHGSDTWDEKSQMIRLAWEAVARHTANIVVSEDNEEMQIAMAYQWPEWVIEKIMPQEVVHG